MRVYLFMVAFAFILSNITSRDTVYAIQPNLRNNEYSSGGRFAIFLVGMLFVCISGFRYQVGTDFPAYYRGFSYYATSSINPIRNNEIVINLIARIARRIYNHPQTFIFLCALFTIVPFMIVIKRKSEDLPMSVLLFIFLGCFIGSFNGIRQYLAIGAIMFAIQYTIEGKPKQFYFACTIAFLCHTSAALFFVFYGLVRIKNRRLFLLILGIASIILLFSYDRIFSLIDVVRGVSEGTTSEASFAQQRVNRLRVLVAWAPVLLFLLSDELRADANEYDNVIINMVFVEAALQTVAINSSYLARFCFYTNCANILAIPTLLKHQSESNKKFLSVAVYVLYFIYWLAQARDAFNINYHWCF